MRKCVGRLGPCPRHRDVDAEDVQDEEMFRAEVQALPVQPAENVTVAVVKMKLASFCRSPVLAKRLNHVVLSLNQAIGEAYAFANFHITRLLQPLLSDTITPQDILALSQHIPCMDRNFFYRCLIAVCRTAARPSTLGPEIEASQVEFDKLRVHGKAKVDATSYGQALADLSIQMATMASNHLWLNLAHRVLKYLKWRHPGLKSLHSRMASALLELQHVDLDALFDTSCPKERMAHAVVADMKHWLPLKAPASKCFANRAHTTLPIYFRLLKELEAAPDAKAKKFTLLPTKGGFTVCSIPVSNMQVMALFKRFGMEKFKGDGRNEDHRQIWARHFNLNAVETCHRRFDHRILTDGYSVSIQMAKLSCHKCHLHKEPTPGAELLVEPGVRKVGVDPGITDVVTLTMSDGKSLSFSSRQYYEMAKFNYTARRTKRWTCETQHVVAHIPSCQTTCLDSQASYAKAYLRYSTQLLAHRAKRGYRAMRFLRYINKRKAVRHICDLIAPNNTRSLVLFGDWSGPNGSPVSRRTVGPLQEIRFELRSRKNVAVLEVDEFRSSKVCGSCHNALCNMKALMAAKQRGNSEVKTARCKVHKVLHCKNSERRSSAERCGATWNRDTHASRNILALGLLQVAGLKRPAAFRRQTKTPKNIVAQDQPVETAVGDEGDLLHTVADILSSLRLPLALWLDAESRRRLAPPRPASLVENTE